MYVVKYTYNGKRYAIRVLANSQEAAVNTVVSMTRGRVYAIREVGA